MFKFDYSIEYLIYIDVDINNVTNFHVEIGEIQKFTEQDVSTLTNDDAKTTFFRLLSLPLQSICK